MNSKLAIIVTFTISWSPQVVADEAAIRDMTSEYTAAVVAGALFRRDRVHRQRGGGRPHGATSPGVGR